MTATSHLRAERRGRLGIIRLDRAKALNALDLSMIRAMQPVLDDWATDDGIDAVLLKGEGRAFCAGGDVKAVWEAVKRGDNATAHAFFAEEYRLDLTINRFPKPFISLLNGMVMGGGGGLSILGSHRIVTENTLYAMPECAIGLYPDAGGTWYLPRLPGALGVYLGLTGARLGAADFLASGMGTHFVPADRLPKLEEALSAAPSIDAAFLAQNLAKLAGTPGPSEGAGRLADIDRLFGHAHLEEICAALAREPGDWAEGLRRAMAGYSPYSMKVTLRQILAGKDLDLPRALELEYRLSTRMCHENDFLEGIRSVLVDKDKSPKWEHDDIAAVPDQRVADLFLPLGVGLDLVLA